MGPGHHDMVKTVGFTWLPMSRSFLSCYDTYTHIDTKRPRQLNQPANNDPVYRAVHCSGLNVSTLFSIQQIRVTGSLLIFIKHVDVVRSFYLFIVTETNFSGTKPYTKCIFKPTKALTILCSNDAFRFLGRLKTVTMTQRLVYHPLAKK